MASAMGDVMSARAKVQISFKDLRLQSCPGGGVVSLESKCPLCLEQSWCSVSAAYGLDVMLLH